MATSTSRPRLRARPEIIESTFDRVNMGLQPSFHTIYCGGDRCRADPRAVFDGGALSRRTGPSSGRGGGGVCRGLWWHCRGGDGDRDGAEHDRAGSEGIGAGRAVGASSAAGGGTQTSDSQGSRDICSRGSRGAGRTDDARRPGNRRCGGPARACDGWRRRCRRRATR